MAGDLVRGICHGLDQPPGLGQEHVAGAGECERILSADLRGRGFAAFRDPLLNLGARVRVVVADVEHRPRVRRDDVRRCVRH